MCCAALAEMPADLKQKHEQMLYPVVRVTVKDSGGSGTILYSEDRGDGCQTYVLTNHHVIDGAIHIKEEWSSLLQADRKQEVNDPVTVEVFRYAGGSRQDMADSCRADIVAHDKAHDLALLKLRTARKFDHVARLLPTDAEVHIFQRVWAVGCSLLHPPVVTEGIVDYLDELIDRKLYWMGSAPIIYGNSGGAVFLRHGDDYCFVGVPSRLSVSGFQAVTHMGYFVPIPRIRRWLTDERLTFLTDTKTTPADSFKQREAMRKKAELDILGKLKGVKP
jgi:S1-C subfamily serine protease